MIEGEDFFRFSDKQIPPEKGMVLISEPFLQDKYFGQSVVIITEHGPLGTVGFVLNKPLEHKIHELMEAFPESALPVCLGGPVAPDTLHFIHNLGYQIKGSVHVDGELFWGGDMENLKQIIQNKGIAPGKLKFFVGYSGWSPGQLEEEINRGSWVVAYGKASDILKPGGTEFWRSTLQKLGAKYRLMANFPNDPILN